MRIPFPIKLHVTVTDDDGKRRRRTFVIAEDGAGGVDMCDDQRPRCEADQQVWLGDVQLEIEAG